MPCTEEEIQQILATYNKTFPPEIQKLMRDFLLSQYPMSKVIREAREKRGWSQEALAEKAGVAKQTISNLETKNRIPRLERLNAIRVALGLAPRDTPPKY
jgi:ribosome-binding protein aMBF1 (putative translation factor)